MLLSLTKTSRGIGGGSEIPLIAASEDSVETRNLVEKRKYKRHHSDGVPLSSHRRRSRPRKQRNEKADGRVCAPSGWKEAFFSASLWGFSC